MSEQYWDEAEITPEYSNSVWGKIWIDVSPWFFAGGGAKPVPHDPQNPEHAAKQPAILIDMKMEVLPQMNLQFEIKKQEYNFSKDYSKIVLPSIKALNLTADGKGALKALNQKWVKMDRVEGFQKNTKNPEAGNWKTFKFIKVFRDEAECLADYETQMNIDGQPWAADHQVADATVNPARQTALMFAQVFVTEACEKFSGDKDQVIGYLSGKFAQNPDVGNFVKADSPEVVAMIDAWAPPF